MANSVEKKAAKVEKSPSALRQSLELLVLFVLWYAFNAGYNVYNAYVKDDYKFPGAISAIQLGVGLGYALSLIHI